ncbi:MAG TPA: DPP IV N-terminal domain-containing protein, partial [Myxococcota bacterium]|nr:DPP IV N-terminal domain-containing protein [Myxococcota bacterium]
NHRGLDRYDPTAKTTSFIPTPGAIIFPNSVYGSSIAGTIPVVATSGIAPVNIGFANAGTGAWTDLFDVPHMQVISCGSAGCSPITDIDFAPDFSPDGTHVVFVHSSASLFANGSGSLLVADLSSQNRPITPLAGGEGPARYPEWSPDGQWIVFVGASNDLFVVPASGGQTLQLTNDGATRFFPTWLSALRLPQ